MNFSNEQTMLLNPNSNGWMWFVRVCFGTSIVAMALAIVFLPAAIWVKGYLAMGSLLLMASTFMLAKTMRDEFEAQKIMHKLNEAQAEKILRDVEPA